jgi:hypothetical protein
MKPLVLQKLDIEPTEGLAMLFQFVYLNKSVLAGYTAQVDGGLIAETKTRSSRKKTTTGGLGWRWLSLKGDRGAENEHLQTLSDAPEAQFQRLLAAASTDAEALAWLDVLEPDETFASVQVGEIISWECDVNVPEIFRLVARDGIASKLLEVYGAAIDGVTEGGAKFGDWDGKELTPESRTELARQQALLNATKHLLDGADIPMPAVGTEPATSWKVYGTLERAHLLVDYIDSERLIIVGKVRRKVAEGETRRAVNFPDMSKLAAMGVGKQKAANPANEALNVSGPAVELDILAIYR